MAPGVRTRSGPSARSCSPWPRRRGAWSSRFRRRRIAVPQIALHEANNCTRPAARPVAPSTRHFPAHEVAVAGTVGVGSLAEDRVGNVAEMQVRQVGDLGGDPGAAFALLGGGMAVPPHEVVGDELPACGLRTPSAGAAARGARSPHAGVDLGHGAGAAGPRRSRRLPGCAPFPDPQLVQFGLESGRLTAVGRPGPLVAPAACPPRFAGSSVMTVLRVRGLGEPFDYAEAAGPIARQAAPWPGRPGRECRSCTW